MYSRPSEFESFNLFDIPDEARFHVLVPEASEDMPGVILASPLDKEENDKLYYHPYISEELRKLVDNPFEPLDIYKAPNDKVSKLAEELGKAVLSIRGLEYGLITRGRVPYVVDSRAQIIFDTNPITEPIRNTVRDALGKFSANSELLKLAINPKE